MRVGRRMGCHEQEIVKSIVSLFERLPQRGFEMLKESSSPVAGYKNIVCISMGTIDADRVLHQAVAEKNLAGLLDHTHSIQIDPMAKVSEMDDIFRTVSDKHPVPLGDKDFLAACAGHRPERGELVVVVSVSTDCGESSDASVCSSWFLKKGV